MVTSESDRWQQAFLMERDSGTNAAFDNLSQRPPLHVDITNLDNITERDRMLGMQESHSFVEQKKSSTPLETKENHLGASARQPGGRSWKN